MPRKILYDTDAYAFLMDLSSRPGSAYEHLVKKIHAIAKNPAIRGSVHVSFDMEIELQDGSETMLFTQCRYVDFRGFTITYTWSDRNDDTLYITEIYNRE
jgi:hypothetical protein